MKCTLIKTELVNMSVLLLSTNHRFNKIIFSLNKEGDKGTKTKDRKIFLTVFCLLIYYVHHSVIDNNEEDDTGAYQCECHECQNENF